MGKSKIELVGEKLTILADGLEDMAGKMIINLPKSGLTLMDVSLELRKMHCELIAAYTDVIKENNKQTKELIESTKRSMDVAERASTLADQLSLQIIEYRKQLGIEPPPEFTIN